MHRTKTNITTGNEWDTSNKNEIYKFILRAKKNMCSIRQKKLNPINF